MTILLFGATGLLGHNVLRLLIEHGDRVKVVVRDKKKLLIKHENIEVIEGNIRDYELLMSAANGCNAMINCAGVTDMSLLHYEDYLTINRDAVRTMIKVLENTNIQTFVHTSTTNTIGNGTAQHPANEKNPMAAPFTKSLYACSKKEGEEIVLNAAKRLPDKHIIVLCPGFMIGGFDVKLSSGALLMAAYKKPLMAVTKGGKTFVHVMDVAEAILKSLCKGESGKRYIITSPAGTLSLREFYTLQANTMGYRQHIVTMPHWVVKMVGKVGDIVRKMGIRTQVSSNNVQQMMVQEHYCNAHAMNDLGLANRDIDSAIRDFFAWRRENNIK